jgi:WD40 repeat protein
LKEYTLCCFEYLLAKIHGVSIEQLLWELDVICNNIDVLLVQTILKDIMETVSHDPILLAGELISRLKTIKTYYNEHIETLFCQAHEWCESSGIPVFVPLSSWISTTPSTIVNILPTAEGANKIIATSFNQHIFCTTQQHDIAMYHIPSKKLVKKFSGTSIDNLIVQRISSLGHTATINSVQLTCNNKHLVSVSSDRTVKVFNLNTGELESSYT